MLLATDDSAEDNIMRPPEDTKEELFGSLLACMGDLSTITPPYNTSLDHFSSIDTSASVPPMDNAHANDTSVVKT